jgi:hypothetical protein
MLKLIYFHWWEFFLPPPTPQKHCDQLLLFRPSTPFKDLFELSKNFDAPLLHKASRVFMNALVKSGIFLCLFLGATSRIF